MSNTSKRLFLLAKIATGILVGGFLLPPLLPKSDLVSDLWVRVFLAAFIITILNPFPKMMSELGQVYLNPTVLPSYLGLLWPVPIFLIIHYTNADIDFNGFLLWICVPALFLNGCSGFFMYQRDEYIGRHPILSILFDGAPAKPMGAFFMVVFWGIAILLIIAVALHWF
jgi:hypothetical protein